MCYSVTINTVGTENNLIIWFIIIYNLANPSIVLLLCWVIGIRIFSRTYITFYIKQVGTTTGQGLTGD